MAYNPNNELKNLDSSLVNQQNVKKSGPYPQWALKDYLYPFLYTNRVEQLNVMEAASEDDLNPRLVTIGERAHNIEMGIRYGLKETAAVFVVYVVSVVYACIEGLDAIPSLGFALALLIVCVYGIVYTIHLPRLAIGPLTQKVINSLLFGRMLPLLLAGTAMLFSAWSLYDYSYTHTENVYETVNAVFGNEYLRIFLKIFGLDPSVEGAYDSYYHLVYGSYRYWLIIAPLMLLGAVLPVLATIIYRMLGREGTGSDLDNY